MILVGYGGIWWDMVGSGGIWWDLVGSGGIWWDLVVGSFDSTRSRKLVGSVVESFDSTRTSPNSHVWRSSGGSLWNQRNSIEEWERQLKSDISLRHRRLHEQHPTYRPKSPLHQRRHFFSTLALFSSLVGRHSPNFPKPPKTFQSGWSWLHQRRQRGETLPPGLEAGFRRPAGCQKQFKMRQHTPHHHNRSACESHVCMAFSLATS
jgi:hypothetical protein